MSITPSATPAFLAATVWAREDENRFTTTIDPRWYQGRGVFGGVLAAGMLRSMMVVVDDPRREPRTFHMHFIAPGKEGPAETTIVVERVGTTMMTLTGRTLQEGKLIALGSATFAFARDVASKARYTRTTMPASPRPEDVEPIPVDLPFVPRFTQFFEYRMGVGNMPYSGSDAPVLGGWVRAREPVVADAPYVLALLDSLPPPVLALFDEPRGAASVDFTADLHVPLPRPGAVAGAHHLVVASSDHGDGGTTEERADVWAEDGTHLATVRQLVTIL